MALEDIRELTFLKKGADGYYDLFITTNTGISIPLDVFIVERQHEMKMYSVSEDLYDSVAYTGFLCLINDILNPFSIKEGDILLWADISYADQLVNIPSDELSQARREAVNNLFNIKKKPKPDKNRSNFLNRTIDPLPPNVLQEPAPQVVVDNNKIKLTPNTFNNPNSTVSEGGPEKPGTFAEAIPEQEDIERVLVRRYVRNI